MLKVAGLKKAFGILELFHDVNFSVAPGERVGFVGANGAGKTTLMRCLLGTEEPDGGSVSFDSPVAVGYVEQQAELAGPTLYDEFMSAFDDIILLGARKRELEGRIAEPDCAPELLEEYGRIVNRFELLEGYDFEARLRKVAFGLGFCETDFARPTAYLSGGQRTRVVLAKALLRAPEFLFLDEPTSGIDVSARRIFWQQITALAAGGTTVVVTTHFMEEAEFCDRIVIIDQGRMLAMGTPAEVRQRYAKADSNMDDVFIGIIKGERREA